MKRSNVHATSFSRLQATLFAAPLFGLLLFLASPALALPPENLAGKAVSITASSHRHDYPAKNAIDGDSNTLFSFELGASKDQWLQIEWEQPQTIGALVFSQPNHYTESMKVEALQGGKWVRVAQAGPPKEKLGTYFQIAFDPVTTSSLRLCKINSTKSGGAAYLEIEVYSDPKIAAKLANRVDLAVAGDTTGRLLGTVSMNKGHDGLEGARVTVVGNSPLGKWTREAVAGPSGLWMVDLPVNPTGKIQVTAEQEERYAALSVNAMDLAQYLTPHPAEGVLSLDGVWDFFADPPADFQNNPQALAWKPITNPANYEMEGFTTKTDVAAYHKTITIPPGWAGKRIRLRAEAIYSAAELWLNGQRIGSHEGGVCPFEIDLTDAAKLGQPNDLCIRVRARTLTSTIDMMSNYACFEIAGIWRSIELFAAEPVHLARINYVVAFDKDYQDADLTVNVKVVNEQGKGAESDLALAVLDPGGNQVKLDGLDAKISLGPWEAKTIALKTHVSRPVHWNAEQPRNYTLVSTLNAPDQPVAKLEQPLGFRQVEVKGPKFSIDGKPVRLFGACLHAADPLMGRAISLERVKQDLDLMKGANLNAIRTSHYPPHPQMPGVADKLGLYVHDEGPSCWAQGHSDLRNAPLYIGLCCAYIERDRNHPSVVYWSTCNESDYGIIFQLAHRFVRTFDPTRPVGGSYAPQDMDNDMYVLHHPHYLNNDIEKTKTIAKPVYYDECLTIYHGIADFAYSLDIDPGMHDYWETGVYDIRRQIMKYENQVGTMIWAWVDDAFLIPGRGIDCWRRNFPPIRYTESMYKMPGRGYQGDCTWGVVDGWRRPRPEWWLLKKIYTPVMIEEKPLAFPAAGVPVAVPVENLNWFTNLNAYECRWEIAGQKGVVRPDVAPSSKGVVNLYLASEVTAKDTLSLEWIDETGRLVDAYKLRFQEHEKPVWKLGKLAANGEEHGRYQNNDDCYYLRGRQCEIGYDKTSGGMMWALKDSEQVLSLGPILHILNSKRPSAQDPQDWKFTSEKHEEGVINWNGEFGSDFQGGYQIRMDEEGQLEVAYEFKYQGPEIFAREIGLKFELPLSFDRLDWDRAAEHSVYPADHIGRPIGTALGHPNVAQTVPPQNRPFGLDDNAWGCNDFRSTKRGVYTASLTNALGQGVRVISDGKQSVRCSLGVHGITLRVLDFYGGSGGVGEWSETGYHYGPGKGLKKGSVIKGTVRLQLLGASGEGNMAAQ